MLVFVFVISRTDIIRTVCQNAMVELSYRDILQANPVIINNSVIIIAFIIILL